MSVTPEQYELQINELNHELLTVKASAFDTQQLLSKELEAFRSRAEGLNGLLSSLALKLGLDGTVKPPEIFKALDDVLANQKQKPGRKSKEG